ncbi:MAG: Methyltransferase type 12 [Bryobacterales bacterium]|nr:Methyltransferase type 12 [Bryobacterales bacterium]
MSEKEVRLDPVLAYDRIASEFRAISERRRAYLAAIERLVVAETPPGSRSLLDVGAGDGLRAVRIAVATGIKDPVLLEPAAAMRSQWPPTFRGWPIRAEELTGKAETFDVLLCLWNVLGHIFPQVARVSVLRECGRLLTPGGRIFIDVNNRYNAAQYGVIQTLLRALQDYLQPRVENGDVVVRWKVDGTAYATDGHVFTDAEFRRLSEAAGLVIEKRTMVSYSTGEICRSTFAGNPLYTLRRA